MKYAIISFFLITMCEKDDDLSSCKTQLNATDVVCIEIYKPVCGCDGMTYSNTCYATASGVLTWIEGECLN